MVSRNLVDAANSRTSGEEWVYLLTITHADLVPLFGSVEGLTFDGKLRLATPVRQDVVSRGDTFIAFPFQIAFPESSATGRASLSVVIDAIDLRIATILRSITTPASVIFEEVLLSSPDFVERAIYNLELTNAGGNSATIDANLTQPDFGGEPLCWPPNTPATAPGIY